MLVDRSQAENYLHDKFVSVIFDNDTCFQMYDYAYEKYNMPKGLFADYISMRKTLSEANVFELFIMIDSCRVTSNKIDTVLKRYFAENEIRFFKNEKFEQNDTIEFPLRFQMIQINDDQWIGTIDIDTLIKLRKSQIINYNVNTQRTMKRVIRGESEIWEISVNKNAVKEIKESFLNNNFISNTITLNIPVDSNADFYYDKDACMFVINSIERLDISDGYHRFLGLCEAKHENSSLEYKMELRITNFMEEKAQRFIYQEDQKTQMSKLDSKSYDVYDASNNIAKRINESSSCNIQGYIGRNKSKINYGEMSSIIKRVFLDDVQKTDERKAVIKITKELIEDFNLLTEYDTNYLSKTYDFKTLLVVLCGFYYFRDKDKSHMSTTISYVDENIYNYIDKRRFRAKKATRPLIKEIISIMEGVENNHV